MKSYTNLKMNNDVLVNLLCDRVDFWRSADGKFGDMLKDYYEKAVDDGVFEGMEFDPMVIVDNDVINNCNLVESGDPAFDGIKSLYDEQGLGDISCEEDKNGGFSFIEGVDDEADPQAFLVRY